MVATLKHGHNPLPGLIREAMANEGWTVLQLAKRAGIHRVTVWRQLTGRSRPDGTTLTKLAEALGLSDSQIGALLRSETA